MLRVHPVATGGALGVHDAVTALPTAQRGRRYAGEPGHRFDIIHWRIALVLCHRLLQGPAAARQGSVSPAPHDESGNENQQELAMILSLGSCFVKALSHTASLYTARRP